MQWTYVVFAIGVTAAGGFFTCSLLDILLNYRMKMFEMKALHEREMSTLSGKMAGLLPKTTREDKK